MLITNRFNVINIGYLVFLFIALTRPVISSLELVRNIPIHAVVPIALSFLLLLILLISFQKIAWNITSLLIIIFCSYVIMSILWGSQLTFVIKYILPFVVYFAARSFVENEKDVRLLIVLMIVGYAIPVFGSTIIMATGKTSAYLIYGSGMRRMQGLFEGVHTTAHYMVSYSFIYALSLSNKDKMNLNFKVFALIIFVLSIFCLWNTYVRSAFLGMLFFWMFYLYKVNKRYLVILVTVLSILGVIYGAVFHSIFWKDDTWDRDTNLKNASSGRTILWKHNYDLFIEMPFYEKILGNGLGVEKKYNPNSSEGKIVSSHNDYITIIMTLGIVGFILYFSIIFSIFIEIYRYSKKIPERAIYLGILMVFLLTAGVTNGYMVRFGLGQVFWILIGCSEVICKNGEKKNESFGK